MTRRSVLWVILACLLGPASWALAQNGLPATIIQASTLSPADIAQIEQYIQAPLADLDDDDATKIKNARETLLAPFKESRVSVTFRQTYSDKLMPELKKLVGNPREVVAINALRVIGELVTADAAGALKEALTDKRGPIRLFAAMECKRVFDLLALPNQPALVVGDLQGLIDRLGDGVVNESQPNALGGMLRALMAGASVTRANFDLVRRQAMQTLCTRTAERTSKLPKWPDAQPMLDAVVAAQSFVRDAVGQANPALALDQPEKLKAIAFQASVLAWAAGHIKELPQGQPPQARDLVVSAVRVAETSISVALGKDGAQWANLNMASDVAKGNPQGDRDFVEKAARLLQFLEADPYKLGPFAKK